MLRFFFVLNLLLLSFSFWHRNDLPESMEFVPEINNQPYQKAIHKLPFPIEMSGVRYIIEPLYEYDLYGMVVSFNHHDGNYGLHKLWNDHLNIADFCIVWRETATSPYLNRLNFWNGQFTCNVSTGDSEAWSNFKMNQLSNNHLLSDDKFIRKTLQKISVGDQIRITGWLSNYRAEGGSVRGTSLTREDKGNGACETIYVERIEILKPYTSSWRWLMNFSLAVLILWVVVYFQRPFRPG